MSFDPAYPPPNADIESAPLHNQFNSLQTLIDAVSGVTVAQVDDVTTLNPGDPATVSVSVSGTTLNVSFVIPRGDVGAQGSQGDEGPPGSDGTRGPSRPQGDPGPEGPPGEETTAQLDTAIADTSADSNAVGTMYTPLHQ